MLHEPALYSSVLLFIILNIVHHFLCFSLSRPVQFCIRFCLYSVSQLYFLPSILSCSNDLTIVAPLSIHSLCNIFLTLSPSFPQSTISKSSFLVPTLDVLLYLIHPLLAESFLSALFVVSLVVLPIIVVSLSLHRCSSLVLNFNPLLLLIICVMCLDAFSLILTSQDLELLNSMSFRLFPILSLRNSFLLNINFLSLFFQPFTFSKCFLCHGLKNNKGPTKYSTLCSLDVFIVIRRYFEILFAAIVYLISKSFSGYISSRSFFHKFAFFVPFVCPNFAPSTVLPVDLELNVYFKEIFKKKQTFAQKFLKMEDPYTSPVIQSIIHNYGSEKSSVLIGKWKVKDHPFLIVLKITCFIFILRSNSSSSPLLLAYSLTILVLFFPFLLCFEAFFSILFIVFVFFFCFWKVYLLSIVKSFSTYLSFFIVFLVHNSPFFPELAACRSMFFWIWLTFFPFFFWFLSNFFHIFSGQISIFLFFLAVKIS
ncbi:hypothetical protein P9112_004108 [Eukaryota sp. TZLM1-RC]